MGLYAVGGAPRLGKGDRMSENTVSRLGFWLLFLVTLYTAFGWAV